MDTPSVNNATGPTAPDSERLDTDNNTTELPTHDSSGNKVFHSEHGHASQIKHVSSNSNEYSSTMGAAQKLNTKSYKSNRTEACERESIPYPLEINEDKIENAVLFLENSEIQDVSTSVKRKFLERNVGMSKDEIDTAFERVAAKHGMIEPNRDKSGDRVLQGTREFDDGIIEGRNHLHRRRYGNVRSDRHSPRHHNSAYYNNEIDRYDREYYPSNDHTHNMGHSTLETPVQYSQSRNYDPTPRYNMESFEKPNGVDQMVDNNEVPIFTFSLLNWASGFSLGIFCVAALRWLNGGDFILFPPPTASDSVKMSQKSAQLRVESMKEMNGSDDDEETASVKNIAHNNNYATDEDHDSTEESLKMILNDPTDSHLYHSNDVHSSNEELIFEVKQLTSSLRVYLDTQEREKKVATALLGKEMTDDAMDFLRQKKATSDYTKAEISANKSSIPNRDEASRIYSILSEVALDLSHIKLKLSPHGDSTVMLEQDRDRKSCGDTDDGCENTSCAGVSSTIDNVIEKIEKILTDFHQLTNERTEQTEVLEGSGAIISVLKTSLTSTDNAITTTTHSQDELKESTSCESGTSCQNVENALKTLVSSNSEDVLKAGAQMLYLYCMNISKNPTVPRHRKIFTNNTTFQKKVGHLKGAKELLCAIGFVEHANFFEWAQPDDFSSDSASRLEFALVALNMMRKEAITKECCSDLSSPEPEVSVIEGGLSPNPISIVTDDVAPSSLKDSN